jgi:beta-ureidopropionase
LFDIPTRQIENNRRNPGMRVACAQFRNEADREASIVKALSWMKRAKDHGADLIVFPELAFDFFFPQVRADARYFDWSEPIPGPTTERFQAAAADLGLVTVINVFERAAPGRYYDASPVIDADGTLVGVSRMLHIAEEPGYNEKFYYWPGDGGWPVHGTRVGNVGVTICYDRHYPEVFRALALRGAELVVVPTATSMSEQAFKDVWEIEIQAAAVANQIYIAVANRAGLDGELQFFGESFVADPAGRVVARGATDEEDLLVAEVDLERIEQVRRHVPFLRDFRYDLFGEP